MELITECSSILSSGRITLRPLEDVDYFARLVEEDEAKDKEEFKILYGNYKNEFWEVFLDEARIGVVGYFFVNGNYLFEGLKDKQAAPLSMRYAVQAGRMVMDYMFGFVRRIGTCARIEDKAIQRLCKRLGFKEIAVTDQLIIYQKEK